MDFFERYLHAVRNHLPSAGQDDVVRELSEELRSQAEEREAALGRPLTEVEQQQILRQWPHPMLLAARYQPKRHVVGPAVFPVYWLVLKVGLGITLLVQLVAAVVPLAQGKPFEVLEERLFRLDPFLMAFAWVTLVFALLDRAILQLPAFKDWNPGTLPVPRATASRSLWCQAAEIAAAAGIAIWLAALLSHQWLVFGPGYRMLQLGPAWSRVHVGMVVLACASVLVLLIGLRPGTHRPRRYARVAIHAGWMVLLMFVLKSHELIVAAPGAGENGARLAILMNTMARVGVAISILTIGFEIVREMFRLAPWSPVSSRWSARQG